MQFPKVETPCPEAASEREKFSFSSFLKDVRHLVMLGDVDDVASIEVVLTLIRDWSTRSNKCRPLDAPKLKLV